MDTKTAVDIVTGIDALAKNLGIDYIDLRDKMLLLDDNIFNKLEEAYKLYGVFVTSDITERAKLYGIKLKESQHNPAGRAERSKRWKH